MNQAENSGANPASAVFFDAIAQTIMADHHGSLNDLRHIIVCLPNYHAARPLAQALLRQVGGTSLLLPQMVTLNEWAQRIPLDAPVTSANQRNALLYQQLRRQNWFGHADLWSMTQELLVLFDELTHAMNGLPIDADTFAATVAQAYQARQNSTLQLEARLVFELWHAMQSGNELDEARAYQHRLAILATQADKPLYVLRTSDWNVLEQRFLEEYEKRKVVKVFDLRERGNIPQFFAATSLEQEARAAAMQVRIWLQQGKRDIAIVAQDRVVARRMRALLERAEVLVTDETGWTFATLSVSAVLDRWLTLLQSNFYHRDLLDLLKSPYIFADMAASERKSAVYQLEQLLRKHGVVAGLEKFITLAEHEIQLHPLLARLRQAAMPFDQGKKKTLAEWLSALRNSFQVLGIDAGLQQDEAGVQLLCSIQTWQQEMAGDSGLYLFSEWRRWLGQQLDSQAYRDNSIDSPVRFTHLAATRWRAFDAVLLLGCDADHLPGVSDGGRWFNDAVRSSLNLPTRSFQAKRQHDDLSALLTLNDCVLVTWQKERDGEANLLSPFLQLLRDAHEQAHGKDLAEPDLHAYLAAEEAHSVVLPQSGQPSPTVANEIVPERISISAYNSLVACPYQFYARYILRLNELDEVQEGIEKRDYGERVHDILQRFHERYPRVSEHAAGEMQTAIRQISETIFADLLAQNFEARAWLVRWYKSLDAYLEWQTKNEAQGWCYHEAEGEFEQQLEGVRLRGRIDRLDVKEGDKRVLDYKTQEASKLVNKLKEPGEDVQLACYAFARQANEAAFVSIENGKVKSISPPHDVRLLSQLNVERLEQVMEHIRSGTGLPANGIDAACKYCEMRGVCRKGEWS